MSNLSLDFSDNAFQPLAARMRPENLAQYIGQQHLLAPGKPLPRAIEAGHLHSMILWGPPGTGKTTLAEVIARYASADVERISAVTSGVKEIREAIERARQNRNAGRRTILFVDEVHRFNKSQQDAFLPHIEDGTITFIGATTENPSFELNSALLSRARVYLLKSLTSDDIEQVLNQAMSDKTRGYGGQNIVLPDETRKAIADLVNGDARRALNTLEMMADMAEADASGNRVLKVELLTEIAGERSARLRFNLRAAQIGSRQRPGRRPLLVRADYYRRRRSALRCPPLPGDCLGRCRQRRSARDAGCDLRMGLLYPCRTGGRRTGNCSGHCLSCLCTQKQRGLHRV